jgi:hypothetical protein
VVFNVDMSPPFLTLHAPAEEDVAAPGSTSVAVRGDGVDATSGIASVTCNCTVFRPSATGTTHVYRWYDRGR